MNKKGQCGLRVGSSACTTPTVMKATKPRPPLAAYSSHSTSEAQRSKPFLHLHIRNCEQADVALAAQHQTNRVGFFYLALAAPPTPALKGLTSLCGSRSLSCTDLINNFYQPLAQEISRGWAGGGEGVGVRSGWEGWGGGGVG